MHTKALAALFGLSLAACTGVIDGGGGGGGGGDDTGSEGCGDGVTQGGEACDDGNTLSGDGCSATCSTEQQLVPRVTATIDKMTIPTELGKTEQLTVTFTSVDGFTGPVNLAAVVDYGAAEASTWTVTPSKPAANLTAGGTDSITLDVAIPSNTAALAGTIKLDATSSVAPVSLSSTVNVANKFTVVIPAGEGGGPHTYAGNVNLIRIRSGASIVFDNQDTLQHVIHGDGGIDHEDVQNGGMPGTQYTVTPTGDATWYCHTHEGGGNSHNVSVQ